MRCDFRVGESFSIPKPFSIKDVQEINKEAIAKGPGFGKTQRFGFSYTLLPIDFFDFL